MDAPPEEDTERIAKLREQRRADRERRRRAHQQAQAAASDERQAPAQADNSQEAPAQAVQRDEEPVVARAAAPLNAVVVADVAPVAAVAVVPPAPPAPQQERYPDVDAELLGEEIRRERTQIDGFDARATAVCDLLAEAERKLMEAERMEAALLADDDDGGATAMCAIAALGASTGVSPVAGSRPAGGIRPVPRGPGPALPRRSGRGGMSVRVYIMSSPSSSSSNSPPSRRSRPGYRWYSDTRSFMLDSASVNSISSMPSPVYQWRRLAAEHGRELLGDALPRLLDGRRVADERRRHLEALRGCRNGRLDVVRSTRRSTKFLLTTLQPSARRPPSWTCVAAEEAGAGEVAAVARVGGAHHVLGVELLLRELRHRERAVLLRAARRERREADHEEVEPRKDHVDRELAEVAA